LSNEIICPECKQLSRININDDTDDKVSFICDQYHFIEIPKNEYEKSQMITKLIVKCKCNSIKKKNFV